MELPEQLKQQIEARAAAYPAAQLAQAAQSLPNYCVRIPEDWDGAGKSLGELKYWRATGATVVAIRRSGEEIVSPGPDTALRRGDLVIFVGDLAARRRVVQFLSEG